jgi:hypothetical protein
MALLDHRWEHFAGSIGDTPPERLRLPTELAEILGSRAQRAVSGGMNAPQSFSSVDVPAELMSASFPAPLVQRTHVGARKFGVQRGQHVVLRARYGLAPTSPAEFEARPVAVDGFVITPGATNSPLAKAAPALANEQRWVWRVLRIFAAGERLPANTTGRDTADVDVFEAQLYAPGTSGLGGPMRPCWDKMSRGLFLRTRAEKLSKRLRQSAAPAGAQGLRRSLGSACSKGSENPDHSVYEPMCAYLRAGSIYGGVFF